MKKMFCLFLVSMMSLSLFAYTARKRVNVGIPNHVNHIEFWNGGTKIAEVDDCFVEVYVEKDESLLTFTSDGNSIQFYTYAVSKNGKTIFIIDSEALAILYN